VLLLLAHFGKEGKPEPVIAKISQECAATAEITCGGGIHRPVKICSAT
jgi:hypothetical protein